MSDFPPIVATTPSLRVSRDLNLFTEKVVQAPSIMSSNWQVLTGIIYDIII